MPTLAERSRTLGKQAAQGADSKRWYIWGALLVCILVAVALSIYFGIMSNRVEYKKIPNLDSNGNDLEHHPDLANNVNALQDMCNKVPGCKGFNTNGWLKSKIETNLVPSNGVDTWVNNK